MHIVSRRTLKAFSATHADAANALDAWYHVACRAKWTSIVEVRAYFPHADAVHVASGRTATVFNIGGNKYRLVTDIHYNRGKIYVLRIMTHKDYSSNRWKEIL
ncbi:MAG: type II toxin-antitoxin system HigB family toxin [Phycisphaerales bacterium]|nr:type II toxin-antitoxin system HigB family toxin [Phycisphaerales bacterium]